MIADRVLLITKLAKKIIEDISEIFSILNVKLASDVFGFASEESEFESLLCACSFGE